MAGHNRTQNRMAVGRAIISALVLWLAFCGMAAAEQLYVNESGWWRDSGVFNASTAPIQAAVGAAGEGDSVFVWNGSYSENVDVGTAHLTLEGEGADVVTVTGAESGDPVFEVTADYVNISGFAVTEAIYYSQMAEICGGGGGGGCPGPGCWQGSGIFLSSVGYCSLTNINASGNRCGIYIRYSNNNTLQNNTVNSNPYHGIRLSSSSNNTLVNNNASNNGNGISLSSSSNNNLTGNRMSGNSYNFGVDGDSLSHFIQNMDISNRVNEKAVYYFVGQQNKQVPNDAGFVGIVSSTNITVRDSTLTNNSVGVLFVCTNGSRIENITASGNKYGISMDFSSNNTLFGNTVSDNSWGIFLNYSSGNNLIDNIANLIDGVGIDLYDSSNNALKNNTVNSNRFHGIRLWDSSNNMLTNNIANSNDDCGIELAGSNNNTLVNNNVSNNFLHGISLSSSSNNTLTNNIANSNNYGGISVWFSNSTTLQGNTASNNGYDSFIAGICIAYSNNNSLQNNTASNNGNGIRLYDADANNITCNLVAHNQHRGFFLYDGCTDNNISYNNIIENGNYNTETNGREWQIFNFQSAKTEARHNYWGAGMNNSTIDASIYEWDGEVEFYPFETEPVLCAPSPEAPHTFTTADAMIALQIAVGSRPSDLRWDVSGDGSVTSLDALMILQAAAGKSKGCS